MERTITATRQVVEDYQKLFVNRRAYTIQSLRPHPETGRFYYFRPSKRGTDIPMMEGNITVGLIEMVRTGRTYELLITQHRPGEPLNGKRPALETKVIFRGIHGRLELDLAGKDKNQAGNVIPTFYSLAGEEVRIPKRFRAAVQAITKAVNCTGCTHNHFVRARNDDAKARAAVSAPTTRRSEKDQSEANVA